MQVILRSPALDVLWANMPSLLPILSLYPDAEVIVEASTPGPEYTRMDIAKGAEVTNRCSGTCSRI